MAKAAPMLPNGRTMIAGKQSIPDGSRWVLWPVEPIAKVVDDFMRPWRSRWAVALLFRLESLGVRMSVRGIMIPEGVCLDDDDHKQIGLLKAELKEIARMREAGELPKPEEEVPEALPVHENVPPLEEGHPVADDGF